ncbi:alcohol dehydrogenase [Pleurostoma richardsiae]|uniref:Alcohol dehydrogenase n=1 Tax=Pleurostoma richardsiae TaxID=41990 RepID=A0AA38RJR4_9PEZI|nr:alcohol dehydrogenase [Pleurostoma richardsiae]
MQALQISRQANTSFPMLLLVTRPVPTSRPGFALVKVSFSAIQPSDKLNAKGGFSKSTFPRVPGRDYSGEVVDVAPSSPMLSWIGKQVYGTSNSELGFTLDGPHAQFCLIPEAMLVEKPSTLSPCQAATVGVPFTTALRCLTRARTGPGDTVLVLGARGAVGSAAVQLAKALGCRSVLTASRLGEGGVPDVLLSSTGSTNTLPDQVSSLTGGKGVDIVVDTVGNIALMSLALEQLAVRGRYTWIATPRDGSSTMLEFDAFQAYRKEIELIGCNSALKQSVEEAEEVRFLNKLFESGKLEATNEVDIERVKLVEAIEKGYGSQRSKKHVVIEMT